MGRSEPTQEGRKKKYTVWFRLIAPEWTSVIEADSEQEVYEKWEGERWGGNEFQVMECVESLGIDDFEIVGIEEDKPNETD